MIISDTLSKSRIKNIRSALVSITSKLKWLGLLGILGLILDNNILRIFSVFAILVFFEVSIPVSLQGIYQFLGIIYTYLTNKFKLPSKENYTPKNEYILPFSGKWTVANGGITKKLSHSWCIPSQRYGYDFIVLDSEGKSYKGDNKICENYFCYDKEIIAPADGEVVKLVKKYKDSYVDGKNAYCNANDMRGNYIIIKHNNNEYSLIAHIKQNSIIHNIGDKVKQGEIIAKCGNSGNSSEPHIHFQLQLGQNFFTAVGLPICFVNIKAEKKGNYENFDKRDCSENLQIVENKTYIGRGLEVENNWNKITECPHFT